MNPVRGATPDSEAVVSSEDERPWPSSTSFGSLPRKKENGVPGLAGGIWSSQKRGSFNLADTAKRNAAREVRRAAAASSHSALRTGNTPSPGAGESASTLPFAIPLRPIPKAFRSLSHSHGQREVLQQTFGNYSSAADHALPLGLLTEEVDSGSESDLESPATLTRPHPPIGTSRRASTYAAARETRPSIHITSDDTPAGHLAVKPGRRLDSGFAEVPYDQPPRRGQWQSHLGWDDLPQVNESRRHSLADIPTRFGLRTKAAGETSQKSLLGNSFSRPGYDGVAVSQPQDLRGIQGSGSIIDDSTLDFDPLDIPKGFELIHCVAGVQHYARGETRRTLQQPLAEEEGAGTMRYTEKLGGGVYDIPEMYKVPFVEIKKEERSAADVDQERVNQLSARMYPGTTRPGKMLYIVSFKCSRVGVFYLLEGTGLNVRCGDIVIVEADRGQDLGTVQHANVTPEQSRIYQQKYGEEQYKWLMMFSQNNAEGNVNPNAQTYGENHSVGGGSRRPSILANAPATMQGLPRDHYSNVKPKAIKRLAMDHEIKMLGEKEGNEAKAKRTCQQKVVHLGLHMEILDAEWQWDFQKLIFYYYADHYINFKDLITDLYRIYKTRIWLSAVNPASFSQHAMGEPPTGIGPGAITTADENSNNGYTMAYGSDPDPYGAVPPYRIGYDASSATATAGAASGFDSPSLTSLQAANNFQPTANPFQPNPGHHALTSARDRVPSAWPGTPSTGSSDDYNYWYDRSGKMEHVAPKYIHPPNPEDLPINVYYASAPQLPTSYFGAYPAHVEDMAFNPAAGRGNGSDHHGTGVGANGAAARQTGPPGLIGTRASNGNGMHAAPFGERGLDGAADYDRPSPAAANDAPRPGRYNGAATQSTSPGLSGYPAFGSFQPAAATTTGGARDPNAGLPIRGIHRSDPHHAPLAALQAQYLSNARELTAGFAADAAGGVSRER